MNFITRLLNHNRKSDYSGKYAKHNQVSTIKCKDGFTVSIQASESHYCMPRENFTTNPSWTAVELGFPNQEDPHIQGFAEDPDYPTQTVYPFVPTEIVELMLNSHGGVIDSQNPDLYILEN